MDHVYLLPESDPPDDVAIVDYIEFNPRFRAADPVADMAFLVMDLIRHGRRDLAHWFRDAYVASAGDDRGLHGTILRFIPCGRAGQSQRHQGWCA